MSLQRKSLQELTDILEQAKKDIPIGSLRYHYKNSENQYRIIDVVFDTETHEAMVVYTALYNGINFSRLASIFLEHVETDAGTQQRFNRIM